MFSLALIYTWSDDVSVLGIKSDDDRRKNIFYWLRKAAENENRHASNALSNMYASERYGKLYGVKCNVNLYSCWLSVSYGLNKSGECIDMETKYQNVETECADKKCNINMESCWSQYLKK